MQIDIPLRSALFSAQLFHGSNFRMVLYVPNRDRTGQKRFSLTTSLLLHFKETMHCAFVSRKSVRDKHKNPVVAKR